VFTSIMYGFINEVTRQPAMTEVRLGWKRGASKRRSVKRSPGKNRPVVTATGRHQGQLSGKYRVLADSFKRAAGFY